MTSPDRVWYDDATSWPALATREGPRAQQPSPLILRIGDIVKLQDLEFEVVATEFERSPGFPDAVAQVTTSGFLAGTHISTPWGMLMVVATRDGTMPVRV